MNRLPNFRVKRKRQVRKTLSRCPTGWDSKVGQVSRWLHQIVSDSRGEMSPERYQSKRYRRLVGLRPPVNIVNVVHTKTLPRSTSFSQNSSKDRSMRPESGFSVSCSVASRANNHGNPRSEEEDLSFHRCTGMPITSCGNTPQRAMILSHGNS